ncbi:MAG: hypothetical protein H7222_01665 [Methylotenera sp.]|nr:hypothetical protein [Oligoflexia bacterium]
MKRKVTQLWSFGVLICAAACVTGTLISVSEGTAAEATPEHATEKAGAVSTDAKAGEAKSTGTKTGDAARAPAGLVPSVPGVAAVTTPASKGCLADNLAIDDIQKRREELDQKSREIASREAELKAREVAVEEELKKLDTVRDQIKQSQGIAKKQEEERVSKLVETFETMSPKSAMQLISNIDEDLAVVAIGRISTAKLAKIMNLMEASKASHLTELLAGVAHAKKPAATPQRDNDTLAAKTNTKGGDKNDGNQQSTHTPVQSGGQREPASKISSEKGK